LVELVVTIGIEVISKGNEKVELCYPYYFRKKKQA
jgi:hypothetical protein